LNQGQRLRQITPDPEVEPRQVVERLRLPGIQFQGFLELPDGGRVILQLEVERPEIQPIIRLPGLQPGRAGSRLMLDGDGGCVCIRAMKNRFLGLLAGVGLVMALAGCYSTQESNLKFGVPFQKDTIVSRYERPYAQVYAAAKEVLRRMGTLTNDDIEQKLLKGRVDGCPVWIKLDDSEPQITKLSIQARTSGGSADIDRASEIDKQIYGVLISKTR
jgi:hypothetical protein